MAITQTQRIIDLVYAGHPRDDVASLLGVSPATVEAAVQDLNQLPSAVVAATFVDVSTGTLETTGNADIGGTLGVDGAATFDGPVAAASVAVTGEVGAGTVESEGGIGFFGTEPPGAAAAIDGALSTVADAPAKAVLTSIIAALVATGQATNATT